MVETTNVYSPAVQLTWYDTLWTRLSLEWLLEVRKNNGIVSGLQLQVAADSVLHTLMNDIYDFDDIPHGRTIAFATSWRSRMTQEYSVAYCGLKREAGSVDKMTLQKGWMKFVAYALNLTPTISTIAMRLTCTSSSFPLTRTLRRNS